MPNIKRLFFLIFFISSLIIANICCSQDVKINNDSSGKKIIFSNKKIEMVLDYNKKACITSLIINKQSVINTVAGIYTQITTNDAVYSSLHLDANPLIQLNNKEIAVTGIKYGDEKLTIHEDWIFQVSDSAITFSIKRNVSAPVKIKQAALPVFMFSNINTWEGAYQDYGGLAWFYLFNKKLDTYGVHSNTSRFWNSATGTGLAVAVQAQDNHIAMDYSRTADDQLAYRIMVSPQEAMFRFDSGTQRRRYVRDTMDVWDDFTMPAGNTTQTITLSYFNFNDQFGRGNLVGINGKEVSAVLNTIARIGVIDKEHFGGNSWHTPYGPICLHEQYIAQMGLAINDNTYLKGYEQCLDFYRDNAIKADGRVWPRWAYSNEDAMPAQFTDKGFYEAQWGYLMDSNPDLVTNVSELYNQTGDLNWVKTHQPSCEKALDWILQRDSNNNGLVEMVTDSFTQKRGSDWIDIIWASYENAFVNAKLYHALVLWSGIEKQLGNKEKENYYTQYAEKLKINFNKPTTKGGFWDEDKKCYVHWLDEDGSIHGNNMVTPVNFMAIAYGICDDNARKKTILDAIELQMQKENLFFWPICMYSYAKGEGNDWQFPFPNYENGDLFLSWGAVAVNAYAFYKPELAVKYVKKVLEQYAKDGLAFQRYGRAKQDGLGDDILSGNSLSVVGLYQAIYGINPIYNRLYLNPHITKELSGTSVNYNFRNEKLIIQLAMHQYAVSNNHFTIQSKTDFGFYTTDSTLLYFNRNNEQPSLKASVTENINLKIEINKWNNEKKWLQSSSNYKNNDQTSYEVNDLQPGREYIVLINNKDYVHVKSNAAGSIAFHCNQRKNMDEIIVKVKN